MKAASIFLLLVLLAGDVSGEGGGALGPSSGGLLSFSLTPVLATSTWPNDRPVGYSAWIGPSGGIAVSCRYRLPSKPLFIGTDLGYSVAVVPYSWTMSIMQAGLSAGFQTDPRSAVGLRLFGSAGYSFDSIQGPSKDFAALFLPSDRTVASGGTPYVGAGAEVSWSFIPSLSLAAGVRFRYLLDLYADVGATLGISLNIPLAGPQPAKPAMPRAAPLKDALHPRVPTGQPGRETEILTQSLTPKEPGVLLISNEISSTVEPSMNHALDRNLQLAVGLHEALRVLGVACVPPSPEDGAAASAKSPLQTLRDGSGDSGDLSVLYSSLLMPLGVQTAFITTPGRIFIAVALAASEGEMQNASGSSSELLFRAGRVWVPIDVTARGCSFVEAWQAGLEAWRGAKKKARFCPIPVDEPPREPLAGAWNGDRITVPDPQQLVEGFRRDVALLVDRAIHDREEELLTAVSQGRGGPRALNALGVLYARYDLFERAEVRFRAAAEAGEFAPALVNLGNLRLREGLAEEALGFYQRAAAAAPHDPAALIGLARSHYELGNWGSVQEAYLKLRDRSPELAEQFRYLQLTGEEAARAAEIDRMNDILVWGEEK